MLTVTIPFLCPDPSLTTDNVMEELGEVEGKWRELADWLYIPESKRDDIAVTHHSDSDRLRAVMEYWIQTSPCPSWKRLVSALEQIDMFTLAEHVRDKYCGGNHSILTSTSGVCTCLACMIDKDRSVFFQSLCLCMLCCTVCVCVCVCVCAFEIEIQVFAHTWPQTRP